MSSFQVNERRSLRPQLLRARSHITLPIWLMSVNLLLVENICGMQRASSLDAPQSNFITGRLYLTRCCLLKVKHSAMRTWLDPDKFLKWVAIRLATKKTVPGIQSQLCSKALARCLLSSPFLSFVTIISLVWMLAVLWTIPGLPVMRYWWKTVEKPDSLRRFPGFAAGCTLEIAARLYVNEIRLGPKICLCACVRRSCTSVG